MALGSTQPLTEMSTRSISWGYRQPVCKADNLTTILCLNFLERDCFTFTFTASLLDNTYTCAILLPGVICSAWIAHYSRHGFSFVQIWLFLQFLQHVKRTGNFQWVFILVVSIMCIFTHYCE